MGDLDGVAALSSVGGERRCISAAPAGGAQGHARRDGLDRRVLLCLLAVSTLCLLDAFGVRFAHLLSLAFVCLVRTGRPWCYDDLVARAMAGEEIPPQDITKCTCDGLGRPG